MSILRIARQRSAVAAILLLSGCAMQRPVATAPIARPATLAAPDREAGVRRALLSVHAAARGAVDLPPLAWDEQLAADARRQAAHLAAIGALVHDGRDDEGENLWAGTRGAFAIEQMADAWVSERRLFRNVAGRRRSATGRVEDVGHYTQIVWRGTRSLGCAMARGAREDVLVCRYAPAGNYAGERAY